jgi:hypothetical protein
MGVMGAQLMIVFIMMFGRQTVMLGRELMMLGRLQMMLAHRMHGHEILLRRR